MSSSTFIALLRGINVGGRNTVPMAELRSLASGLGWMDVRTYIQSGNVVFRMARSSEAATEPGTEIEAGSVAALEAELERAIGSHFGFSVPVVVRSAVAWSGHLAANPFPDASAVEPNLVMLALSKAPLREGAVDELRKHATNGERVYHAGDALWVHYAGGVGRSKISPGLLDRIVGSPVTTRNWRTAVKLAEMAGVAAR